MPCYSFDLASTRIGTLDVPTTDVPDTPVTAAHTSLLDDTLYVVVGTDVVPMFRGLSQIAEWRGKIIVTNDHPGFGWLRVNGDFIGEVEVRLYVGGVLFYTVACSADTPVRVPAGRYREWEIEVVGSFDHTGITLASSADELRRV